VNLEVGSASYAAQTVSSAVRGVLEEKRMKEAVLEVPGELADALRVSPEEQVARLRRELAVCLYQEDSDARYTRVYTLKHYDNA